MHSLWITVQSVDKSVDNFTG